MTNTVQFKAEYAYKLRQFIDYKRARIGGIYVHPSPNGEGVNIVATDGVILGVFNDKSGRCDEPVFLELKKEFLTLCKNHPLVIVEGDDAKLVNDHSSVVAVQPCAVLDRQYPDYVSLFRSDFTQHATHCISASKFAKLKNAGDTIALHGCRAGGNILVKTNDVNFAGIIMWVRPSVHMTPTVPSFIKEDSGL